MGFQIPLSGATGLHGEQVVQLVEIQLTLTFNVLLMFGTKLILILNVLL